MKMNTIIVVANLGLLRAYRVAETPTRGRKLDLVEAVAFPEAHGRYADKVTDMAGRFPVSERSGHASAMSTAESLRVGLETERRLEKLAAEQIETVLEREQPEWWNFAASSEIQKAILNQVAPELRERLVRTVPADLTKAPPAEVLEHFMPPPKTG